MELDPHAARKIRLLGLDVDGVLTDNGLWLGAADGTRIEFKRFDIQDGLGLALLRGTDIEVVWISARPSPATRARAEELGIVGLHELRDQSKESVMDSLLAERGIGWDALAYVGDDLADLAVLARAGIGIAVSNAVAPIRSTAQAVTTKPGGHGAVREIVEALLDARGEWTGVVTRFTGRLE